MYGWSLHETPMSVLSSGCMLWSWNEIWIRSKSSKWNKRKNEQSNCRTQPVEQKFIIQTSHQSTPKWPGSRCSKFLDVSSLRGLPGSIDPWSNKIFRSFCYGPDKMIAKLGETIEPSSRNKQHEYERKLKEKLEKLVASCQVPPWSNNQTNSGLESRYQHMVAVGKLHHNSIYCMSDIISQFKMLETSTKNILVKGSSLELMIIRAAFLKVSIFIHFYRL